MNLKGIVREYLEKNGFDGLFNEDACGCLKDDLFPCENPEEDCIPGYRHPCTCGDHDWHIGTKEMKEQTEAEIQEEDMK